MNQNIPKRFCKDKIYYSKYVEDGTLTAVYKYYTNQLGDWEILQHYDRFRSAEVVTTYPRASDLYGTIMIGEVFISEEEYENILFMEELKK